jgi:hypothetical protein
MKGDTITWSEATRRQSARKAFGFGRKPFVSPYLFVKHECRAFWSSSRLVHQCTYRSLSDWLVSHCCYAGIQIGRAALPRYFRLGKTVAVVG